MSTMDQYGDMEQEPLTNRGRFQPPSNMGGPSRKVPKMKLPPQPKAQSYVQNTEKAYFVKMYIIGLILCGIIEALLLACLSQWHLQDVAVIFTMIFACAAIFLTCIFWNKPAEQQITMTIIGVAAFAALAGGMFGGSFLQTFWHYGGTNTWTGVGSGTKPSSWKGGSEVANVFDFVDKTYVKTVLAGVVYRSGDLAYCVAPILGKANAPPEEAIYYAASIDCCSGTSKANVNTHCYHWGDHDLVGEKIPENDLPFFQLAVTKTAMWNGFMSDPEPVFLNIMTKKDHLDRQDEREKNGLIVLLFTPFGWPLLGIILVGLRWLTIATCGVRRKGATSFNEFNQV